MLEDLLEEDVDELYEHAPCGYLSMLPDGRIVKANETLAGWLGLTRAELLARTFQDLLTVAGRIFHDTHYMPLLMMQGHVREVAFDLVRRGRAPLPVIVTTTSRRDASGRGVLYRTTLFDCTDRRAYEQELVRQRRAAEEAATAKAALLAMISHDMRSPLGSIIMAADLLEGMNPPAKQLRYVSLVQSAARSVLDLCDAILEHTKLESGTAAWQAEEVDLRVLVAELTAILSVKAEAKRIALRTDLDPRLPAAVRADRFKLSQILTNLISNAIKFTEHGGVTLAVAVRDLSEGAVTIEVRVTDTGIGIAADKVETIFEEFRQADSSTARRYGGTGLGLAIVRKLVALAGGEIHVESRLGAGSTFSFVLQLPLA